MSWFVVATVHGIAIVGITAVVVVAVVAVTAVVTVAVVVVAVVVGVVVIVVPATANGWSCIPWYAGVDYERNE